MNWGRILRTMAWNAVLGVVALAFFRWAFFPDLPLWWPLLLAIVFGFPGTLAAVLIWWYLGGA